MNANKYNKILMLIRLWVLAMISVLTIVSCQGRVEEVKDSSSNTTDCHTVEHEAGQTQICGQPERIVALGPYIYPC